MHTRIYLDIDVDESEIFEPLCKLMNECWYPEPKARLSVLRYLDYYIQLYIVY